MIECEILRCKLLSWGILHFRSSPRNMNMIDFLLDLLVGMMIGGMQYFVKL